jgi:acetyltransferase-like isoleucine patch superfamily enzyme/acyl carrier protein
MRTLYLCGVGNGEGLRLALQVNRASARWQQIVLLDDDAAKHGQQRIGLTVAGAFDRLREADPVLDEVVNLVTRTAPGRAKARERIAGFGIPFASLVHPGVDLLGTELAPEVTVYSNTSIGAESSLSSSSVVLVGAVIGHGSLVGRGCVIAPNAVINARVVLEDQVYVGSNASILPDLRIGAGATIAANTLVLSDIPAGATALGVPATVLPAAVAASVLDDGDGGLTDSATPTDRSKLLADITDAMRQVLSLDAIPQDQNFFDLGGTSLKAIQLCQVLSGQFGLPAQPLDLFRFPSVAALARHYAAAPSADPVAQRAQQRAALRRVPLRR